MLGEIWAEESFKRLSKEPLQADNREGLRTLSRVSLDNALPFENFYVYF